MEQPIEDRGSEDLVASEDFRPRFDTLVRGDQDRALLVAMRDDAEEQRRILSGHRLEADFVQDAETGIDVLFPPQERWRRSASLRRERVWAVFNELTPN